MRQISHHSRSTWYSRADNESENYEITWATYSNNSQHSASAILPMTKDESAGDADGDYAATGTEGVMTQMYLLESRAKKLRRSQKKGKGA